MGALAPTGGQVMATADVSQYVQRFQKAWRASVLAIIAAGQVLIDAKKDLKGNRGAFGRMLKEIKFSDGSARKLMAIAKDARIRSNWNAMPASWTTLYPISQLKNKDFQRLLADGTINPGMQCAALSGSRDSDERYLPPGFADALHYVMGGVDLDPASCPAANKTINAPRIITKKKDGLLQEWDVCIATRPTPRWSVGQLK
jgi:hypothetical protein